MNAPADVPAWLAAARSLFAAAFPERLCPLRVTVEDADRPSAAIAYILPLPHPEGPAALAAAVAPVAPGGLPFLILPPVSSVLLSRRERVVLDRAALAPLDARTAMEALVAAGFLRRTPKVPQTVRSLLSRMARRRGLLSPPAGQRRYGITAAGKAALVAAGRSGSKEEVAEPAGLPRGLYPGSRRDV